MIIYNTNHTITTGYSVLLNPEVKYNESIMTTIGNKTIEQYDKKYLSLKAQLRLSHAEYNTLIEIKDDDLQIFITPDNILPGYTVITDLEVLIKFNIARIVGGLVYYVDIVFTSEVL